MEGKKDFCFCKSQNLKGKSVTKKINESLMTGEKIHFYQHLKPINLYLATPDQVHNDSANKRRVRI